MNLTIEKEKEKDWYETELVAKRAFWNLHVPGCNEHYLVHILRDSKDYLPELSRIVKLDGKVIAEIFYCKARVEDGDKQTEVLTFGPLCVDPDYQNSGIGANLLMVTMQLAREAGYQAIIIYGEPGYYPKHGFKTCDEFDITTPDGKNFDAFMGIELVPGALSKVKGKFYEPDVYELSGDEVKVEEYDKGFPKMQKLKLPHQWK